MGMGYCSKRWNYGVVGHHIRSYGICGNGYRTIHPLATGKGQGVFIKKINGPNTYRVSIDHLYRN